MADNNISLGNLEFQIEATGSDKAVRHLNSLSNSLNKLSSAVSSVKGFGTAVNNIKKLSDSVTADKADAFKKLASAMSSLQRVSDLRISASVATQIGRIVTAAQSLRDDDIARIERLGAALQTIGTNGDVRINITNNNTSNVPSTPVGEDSSRTVEEDAERANVSVRSLRDTLASIGGAVRVAFGSIVSGIRQIATSSDFASRSVRGLIKYTALLPITLGSGLASKVKESVSSLGHLFSAIKRIALYRLIRSVIREITQGLKEGIQNIYAYSRALSGEFASAMDSLATSSLYLKNSLGAMAAPIIQSLIPAINWAIDRIVALMNVINMFVAALGGKATTTVAKRVETVFNAAGSAAGGAAGAAKKALDDLKTFTIGIDELNIIDPKDKSGSGSGGGGGGGGGGIDPSSMFEEVDINKGISDFATKLKNAIKAQKWDQVGKILGDKFNEVVGNIKWNDIGANIGSKLGAAITISYNFLKTADTYTLGEKIADFFNSAINRVNTNDLGRLLVSAFTKGIDFLIGFSLNLNMRQVAQKINDFLKGAFNEAREWLGGRDWYEVGSKLRTQITDFFKGIDWNGIWKDLIAFLKTLGHSALDLMLGLLGIDGQKTQEKWTNALNDFFNGGNNIYNTKEGQVHKIRVNTGGLFGGETRTITVPVTPVVQNNSKQWKSDLTKYWTNGVNTEPVAPFATTLKNDSDLWFTTRNIWWNARNREPVSPFSTNLRDESGKWITTRNTAWNSKNGTPVAPFTTNVKKEGGKWRTDVENEWSKNTPTLRSNVGVKFDGLSAWNQVKSSWEKYAGTLTTKIGLKTPIVEAKTTKLPSGLEVPTWSISGYETKWGAKGGILEKAALIARKGSTLIGGGEAGREALLPLDQNTGWMDTIAEKVRDTMANASQFEYSGVDKILSRLDAIEAKLGSVDDNTRIQAEKPSNTYVSIGGKAVRDAVVRQTKADGYSFA